MKFRLRRRRRAGRQPVDAGGRQSRPARLVGALPRALARVLPTTTRSWDVLTVLAGVVLFVVSWPTLFLTHDIASSLAPAVAALSVLPLLLIRISPMVAWSLSMLAAVGVGIVFRPLPTYDFPWQPTHFLVLLATVIAAALTAPWRQVAAVWGATVAVVVVFMPWELKLGWAVAVTMVVAASILLRGLLASRRQLRRQEAVSETERARRAVLEERSRVARDLHDVVAHRMSMVVVQAQSASRRLDQVPPHIAREFEAIGEQAREALNEVRGMLGVLRSDGQLPEDAPQPGFDDLERLLSSTRAAGVDVEWSVTGEATGSGGAAGMVVYRILQESLANATRHAAGAPVRVRVDHEGDAVTCSVVNAAAGAGSSAASTGAAGTGIAGMTARASSVGGEVTTQPTRDGGFAVRARIPLRTPDGPDAPDAGRTRRTAAAQSAPSTQPPQPPQSARSAQH